MSAGTGSRLLLASFGNGEPATFAGIRHVAGFALALLKRGDDIMVMPMDDATARRLGRVRVDEEVIVQPTGVNQKEAAESIRDKFNNAAGPQVRERPIVNFRVRPRLCETVVSPPVKYEIWV